MKGIIPTLDAIFGKGNHRKKAKFGMVLKFAKPDAWSDNPGMANQGWTNLNILRGRLLFVTAFYNRILEDVGRFEHHDPAGLDRYFFTGLGIAPNPFIFVPDNKGPKRR